LRALPVVLVGAVVIACVPARSDREVRLERLAAERRSLEATFDVLEDRLLVNQARVRFWQEMRGRHEGVSAIACASLDQHADAMASNGVPSLQHSSLHRSRVASASAPPAVERVPASTATRD
jgi:hypothetical protein